MKKKFIYILTVLNLFTLNYVYAQPKIDVIKLDEDNSAWLVSSDATPMVSLKISFELGAKYDPQDKKGLSNLLASTMDEGADKYDSKQFQEFLNKESIKLYFSTDHDYLTANLTFLKEDQQKAFELLKIALTKPRFDDEAVQRIKNQIYTMLKDLQSYPEAQASEIFRQKVFGKHPYANRINGTIDTVKSITKEDLKNHNQNISVKNAIISIAGDISKNEAKEFLGDLIKKLPQEQKVKEIASPNISISGDTYLVKADIPQSSINFVTIGIQRQDKDFIPAYVMNYILGGGGFSSRFMNEIREKNGLAYNIDSRFSLYQQAALWTIDVATENKNVSQVLQLVKTETKKMIDTQITDNELENAKKYLIGSYPANYDSNVKLVNLMDSLQISKLQPDYLTKREHLIESVTKKDIQNVAKRVLSSKLMTIITGNPNKDVIVNQAYTAKDFE